MLFIAQGWVSNVLLTKFMLYWGSHFCISFLWEKKNYALAVIMLRELRKDRILGRIIRLFVLYVSRYRLSQKGRISCRVFCLFLLSLSYQTPKKYLKNQRRKCKGCFLPHFHKNNCKLHGLPPKKKQKKQLKHLT